MVGTVPGTHPPGSSPAARLRVCFSEMLMIPNSDAYCERWGAGYFYELPEAAAQFDQRLDFILNYKGATSGKVWKDWSEAIAGFDIQVSTYTIHQTQSTYRV